MLKPYNTGYLTHWGRTIWLTFIFLKEHVYIYIYSNIFVYLFKYLYFATREINTKITCSSHKQLATPVRTHSYIQMMSCVIIFMCLMNPNESQSKRFNLCSRHQYMDVNKKNSMHVICIYFWNYKRIIFRHFASQDWNTLLNINGP